MKGKEKIKMLQCSHCPKEFRYHSEMKRHELSHFAHFECDTCSKTFSFISALRRHQKQHQRTESVPCKKCKHKFKDEVLLKRHMKYAHKGTFICDKCNSKFNSELALCTHMKTHQPEAERRFKCSHKGCTKTFNFSHHLKHHELTHTNTKQHFCSVCGKGFIQSHHLKTHLKSHDIAGRLRCNFSGCKKMFSTDYARKRHMTTHKSESDYGSLSDSNSCDISASSIEHPESILCFTCGQTVPEQDYLIHSDNNCKNVKDSKIDIEVAAINEGNISQGGSNFNEICIDDDVPNKSIEEWPASPFKPINYININYFNLETKVNSKGGVSNESEMKISNNLQCFKNPNILDNNLPVIKVNNMDDYNQVGQRDICEGCDCANICNAKISMYDIPNSTLLPKDNVEYRNGVVKLIDTVDDDIVTAVKMEADNGNLEDKRFVSFSTCRDVLGNCLVSGESCLCARMMAVEDQAVLAQEIEDITPHPGLTL